MHSADATRGTLDVALYVSAREASVGCSALALHRLVGRCAIVQCQAHRTLQTTPPDADDYQSEEVLSISFGNAKQLTFNKVE
jgi:hypothetical protein